MSSLNKLVLALLAGFLFGIVLNGCAPTVTKSTSSTSYEEDISIHRTKYPAPDLSFDSSEKEVTKVDKPSIEPTQHLKVELDSVMAKIKKSREEIDYINGLTIQVYSGNNRDKANSIKRKVYSVSEDYSPRISYDQPNYKVRVGNYYTRLEAYKDYSLLKKKFQQALLVPKRIPIQQID